METRYSFFIHTTPKLPYLIPEQPKPDQSHQLVVVSARVLPSEAILQRPRGLRGSAVIGTRSDDDQPPALHHRRVYTPRSPKTHSGGFSDEVFRGRGGLEGAEGVGGSVGEEMAMVWLGSEVVRRARRERRARRARRAQRAWRGGCRGSEGGVQGRPPLPHTRKRQEPSISCQRLSRERRLFLADSTFGLGVARSKL